MDKYDRQKLTQAIKRITADNDDAGWQDGMDLLLNLLVRDARKRPAPQEPEVRR